MSKKLKLKGFRSDSCYRRFAALSAVCYEMSLEGSGENRRPFCYEISLEGSGADSPPIRRRFAAVFAAVLPHFFRFSFFPRIFPFLMFVIITALDVVLPCGSSTAARAVLARQQRGNQIAADLRRACPGSATLPSLIINTDLRSGHDPGGHSSRAISL
jgi:hypothetical protein